MKLARGNSFLVVGLGLSGQAAARLLKRLGCSVWVTEQGRTLAIRQAAKKLKRAGIHVEWGGHSLKRLNQIDVVVVSPGVNLASPFLKRIKARRIPIIGEMELAARLCSGTIVAISGSNGKSTVTSWVTQMLKNSNRHAMAVGNIGRPLSASVSSIRRDTRVVLEVSSFQLETIQTFHPKVACLLNISKNHLDRHGSFAAYLAAKRQLLLAQRQGDVAVLNADDPVLRRLRTSVKGKRLEFSILRRVRGAYLKGDALMLHLSGRPIRIARTGDLRLTGSHNVANALAAMVVARVSGASVAGIRGALKSFKGLSHRLERVGRANGVTFINDSKSTTVEATLVALEACRNQAVLIAGGRDKGANFSKLKKLAKRKLRAAVVFGEHGHRVKAALDSAIPVTRAKTVHQAVLCARSLATAGDQVLFSPMCTSFDMFTDFEERGEVFKAAVRRTGKSQRP